MTNRDRAAHLIMEAARQSELPTETAVNAVEALAKAGLLADDLPELTNTLQDGSLVWELTRDGDLHVTLREGKIFLGGKQLHPLVAKELSRNIMSALYAAADYEDKRSPLTLVVLAADQSAK